MLPIVGVPETIALGMSAYRKVFCRATGFEHVSRYISGLLVSENKTLQGIAAQQIYPKGKTVSRRAMHAAVFEAGWDSEALMQQHRAIVGKKHQGRGREVVSLDWTLSHCIFSSLRQGQLSDFGLLASFGDPRFFGVDSSF